MVLAEVQLLHLQLSGITEHRLIQDSRGSNQQNMSLLNHFQQHSEGKGNTLSTVQHVKYANCGINLAKWQETVNSHTARSLAFLLPAKYCTGDQSEDDEMGGACGMYGGEENAHRVFNRATWSKEATWKTWACWEGIKM